MPKRANTEGQKTSAVYQNRYRERMKEKGLEKREVWIRPEHTDLLKAVEQGLRETTPGIEITFIQDPNVKRSDTRMSGKWTTESLYDALSGVEQVTSGEWKLSVVEGVITLVTIDESVPVMVAVENTQILVKSGVLWSVADAPKTGPQGQPFSEFCLEFGERLPLSHFTVTKGFYHLYGALSTNSSLEDIVEDIVALGSNIQEAFEMVTTLSGVTA